MRVITTGHLHALQGPAKRLLRHRRLMLMELRNKLVLSRSIPAIRRVENAELDRLATELPQTPTARVATIMATYKRPDLLQRAVRSALAQTVADQVVIVIDDGGGGLPELPDDPRVLACSLSANTGIASVPRNVGIRLTRSTYVAFLDDDNEWEPEHLEVALAALEAGAAEDRPDAVYTALRRSFPDGQLMDVLSTPFNRRLLAWQSYVDTNSLVLRRFPGLHFSRMRRSRDILPREDWELVYRLSRRLRIVHVPTPTVRYRVNPESFWTDWTPSASAELPPLPAVGTTE